MICEFLGNCFVGQESRHNCIFATHKLSKAIAWATADGRGCVHAPLPALDLVSTTLFHHAEWFDGKPLLHKESRNKDTESSVR